MLVTSWNTTKFKSQVTCGIYLIDIFFSLNVFGADLIERQVPHSLALHCSPHPFHPSLYVSSPSSYSFLCWYDLFYFSCLVLLIFKAISFIMVCLWCLCWSPLTPSPVLLPSRPPTPQSGSFLSLIMPVFLSHLVFLYHPLYSPSSKPSFFPRGLLGGIFRICMWDKKITGFVFLSLSYLCIILSWSTHITTDFIVLCYLIAE